MARGWESKSIESQQDAAATPQPRSRAVDPADAERLTRRSLLLLARTCAEADLQAATAAPHRAMLEGAIAELNRQIDELQ